jgi:hypothetical protein
MRDLLGKKSMNQDFEYIADLIEEFFSQSRTQQSLSIINAQEITGWEVWLQIEFSYFLSNHLSKPEWWREEILDYDQSLEKERKFLKPDFLIRKKGWKRETYVALEFKQHINASNCIANMRKDMQRVERLDQTSINLRSYWVMGVYQRQPKNEIKALIIDALHTHDYEYELNLTRNKVINNTPFGYCIF